MSLDVSLYETEQITCKCGEVHQTVRECVYSSNITHNLGDMADAAGIYKALWRPEEIGIKTAKKLIPILRDGLAFLKKDPDYFKKFDASNGWGTYVHFVPFVEEYLKNCILYPNATVEVDR